MVSPGATMKLLITVIFFKNVSLSSKYSQGTLLLTLFYVTLFLFLHCFIIYAFFQHLLF